MALTLSGSGITSANIVDGTIVNADVNDVAASKLTGALPAIDGSSLTGTGKVLQVVSGNFTSIASTSSTSWQDSGLSVNITPSSTSSKILVLSSTNLGTALGGAYGGHMRLTRDGSAINVGDAVGSRVQATGSSYSDTYNYQVFNISTSFVDSPATASAVTYKIQIRAGWTNSAVLLNYSGHDGNAAHSGRYPSVLTLMEIGA